MERTKEAKNNFVTFFELLYLIIYNLCKCDIITNENNMQNKIKFPNANDKNW